MRRNCFIIILFFSQCFATIHAQYAKYCNWWYFGHNAGLDFTNGAPVAVTNGQIFINEGCATISDYNGNLLFYTDGSSVWDRTHAKTPNGYGLLGNSTSTQSGIIVPKPGSNTIYYVFSVDHDDGPLGVTYSIFDVTFNGGLGDITAKNLTLVPQTSEKVTATLHRNNKDIWVITHESNTNRFFSFLITSTGVSTTPVISTVGSAYTNPWFAGYLKSSTNGKYLAAACYGTNSPVELYDFDNNTGVVSNPISLPGYQSPYGVEFSPDNKLLYISSTDKNIYQVDLQAGSPAAIISSSMAIGTSANGTFALQIGPDGKIYVARSYDVPYLGVINDPNIRGTGCNYVDNGMYLAGKTSTAGLPTFIQSYFNYPAFTWINTCFGDSTMFFLTDTTGIDSVLWDFDDPNSGNANYSKDIFPVHIFSSPGGFNVQAISYHNATPDTTIKEVIIYPVPNVDLGIDTAICEGFPFTLDAGGGYVSYLWQDNSTNQTMTADMTQAYWVEVVDSNGCIGRDTIQLVVNPNPVVILNDTGICQGYSVVLNPGGYNSYLWQDGSTNPTYTVNTPGTYSVEVIDKNGCKGGDSAIVVVYPNPVIDLGADTVLCQGTSILLDPGYTGVGSYKWQDGSVNSTYNAIAPGVYRVEIIDSNGCKANDTKIIRPCPPMLKMPNVFTPNGDGVNDEYYPSEYKDIGKYNIRIYNRWGKMVFESDNYDKKWNGTNMNNGAVCSDGTYFWIVEYEGIGEYKEAGDNLQGTVTLISGE